MGNMREEEMTDTDNTRFNYLNQNVILTNVIMSCDVTTLTTGADISKVNIKTRGGIAHNG